MRTLVAVGRVLTAAAASLLLSVAAWAGDLQFGYVPAPGPGENPAFIVTPNRPIATITVVIDAGGNSYRFDKANVPAGQAARFEWRRNNSVTEATAWVTAEFTDSTTEEVQVPFSWTFGAPLKVDLSRASADVKARTLTVKVTAPVSTAEITAFGAHKKVLDQRTVPIDAGPGEIEIPWVGHPNDVVLLDIKLNTTNAWAGFTYSPWFIDVPHDEVIFESNMDVIRPEEEHKLEKTLTELNEMLDKYGDVVPVKLYLAGCTDTVGTQSHNLDLSRRRARAIGRWLRAHGYSKPIYYHGFGERLLQLQTGDGVDEAANRRVLYLIGSNPPPAGSGIPYVGWTAL